ncbi:hypothetical protein GLOIN_2v1848654 [Rhizophagus irregularis DAOM 181602=DAOM 197198]|uniref:Uncharacterized protein n=1 Tax=Rhizophagus irregularis (strain DAOM 181602 / DAOM 197198 / MUCL 43194) TaxID=747089 RepID=A0A2P4NZV6_RHIID|nr:hypothetical protein GLOIN_2v1848654 [Rhizophagus irregularis DAOM 181602=DAOM 197198]POG58653.1 hypothetical protein GLOIN_2v1848654 [Rhizophagus irregularis DAOM 181602=DAOM 197198]|eukprot:XP_025165519.1 hypothetical protein GLOIN_2v1848654 [Rhizophagus irregularis DAOM 181602=DAOM 197198]
MHHLDLGLFNYQVTYTRVLLKELCGQIAVDELDNRLVKIPRFPGLKIFKNGLENIKRFTANEFRNMMKNLIKQWAKSFIKLFKEYSLSELLLPKLHNWCYHIIKTIREYGAINGFTMETYEFLHKEAVKIPYRSSVIYILEVLLKGTNKNIEYLGFQYCSIDENGFYTLASIIKKSLMLKVVKINGNYSIKKKCMSKLNLVSKKNGTLINGFDDLINEDDEEEEKEGKEKEGKEKELDDNEVEEIHNDMKGKGHDGKEGKEEEGLDVEEEEGDYDEKEGKEEEGLDVE